LGGPVGYPRRAERGEMSESYMDKPKIPKVLRDLLPSRPQRPEDAQCPVCGYYCLGKGGWGCIDKPSTLTSPPSATATPASRSEPREQSQPESEDQ